jgi:hypothetical protein
LIDPHEPLDRFHIAEDLAAQRGRRRPLQWVEMLRDELHEHLAHQTRFSRTGHACDAREDAEREFDGKVVQVVARDAG